MKPFALTLDPKPFALKRLSPLVCVYITLNTLTEFPAIGRKWRHRAWTIAAECARTSAQTFSTHRQTKAEMYISPPK
jgi:hypothetical protein